MKMKFILLIVFLVGIFNISAQDKIRYENFTVNVIDGIVRLDFTLLSGSTCNGIYIYRTSDTFNSFQVGEIPGSCGSPIDPVPYFFIDYNPLINVKSFYRLDFSGLNMSEFLWVEIIDLKAGKVQVRPNPANEKLTLYFENLKKELRHIKIYNLLGIEVMQFDSSENFTEIETLFLESGIYSFTISDETDQILIQNKLIVQH